MSRSSRENQKKGTDVQWRKQINHLHNVLLSHQSIIGGALEITCINGDIMCIVMQKLHNILHKEFISAMREFLDGLGDEKRGCRVSEETASARQNAVYNLVSVLCKCEDSAFMHLERLPSLMNSATFKLNELLRLQQAKVQTKTQRQRYRDLSRLNRKWSEASLKMKSRVT